MLPEITSALQFMGAIILLLVVAITFVGVFAFRLHQDVRALNEIHQAFVNDATTRMNHLQNAHDYADRHVNEQLQLLDSRINALSWRLTPIEAFLNDDAEYVANAEYVVST